LITERDVAHVRRFPQCRKKARVPSTFQRGLDGGAGAFGRVLLDMDLDRGGRSARRALHLCIRGERFRRSARDLRLWNRTERNDTDE
jgi:hypothetical protein